MRVIVILMVAGCSVPPQTAQPLQPDVFGVTMVEETACIGRGGRIVPSAQGYVCQGVQS